MSERRAWARVADALGLAVPRCDRWRASGPQLVALLVSLLAAGPALAHKLNVFATAEGRQIQGEVYFAGGARAADVPVTVTNAAGEVLAQLRTAPDGSFRYQAKAPVVQHIVAATLDGHRGEWQIGASELAGAFAASAAPADAATGTAAGATDVGAPDDTASAGAQSTAAASGAGAALDPALEAAIERAVARQVRPLREAALAARDAVQFRDVLGGIGYIIGLAGLGLWWQCRRTRGGP
jgi:nickel transport protein